MKQFMDRDFLLKNETAKHLFHDYSENLPLIDYHCHINPQEIAEDRRFENITQVWLGGDHYKWRIMRANGVEERFITGDAPDREKFQKWAEVLPRAIGNPLYHWSHLELRRYFGYEGVLNGDTAEEVWTLCNAKLQEEGMSAKNLIRMSRVKVIGTTDDPADSLEWHRLLKEQGFEVKVLPSFRPDKSMKLRAEGYADYIAALGTAAGVEINGVEDLQEALRRRVGFFHETGCRASDHGLEYVMYAPCDEEEADRIFRKAMEGGEVSREEEAKLSFFLLQFLGREYKKHGWAMQLHFNCIRNLNTRMFRLLGPDTGYDATGNHSPASDLASFLDAFGEELPKTILYSLNGNDLQVVANIMGCFQEGPEVSKIQLGSAWWFTDHKLGMERQLSELANAGVLGNFIGMLTDSRSFLSYTRHEYFRRILCNLIGTWVEDGEYPDDEKMLKEIVEGISYYNAEKYFGF